MLTQSSNTGKKEAGAVDFKEIVALLRAKREEVSDPLKTFVVVIDGRCAAGKTTLAAIFAEELDAPCIHMDDFFLRPEQRTKERYSEAGGNLDRERFFSEVISNIGCDFSYSPFLCRSMTLGEKICIRRSEFLVIEGAYSLHPSFGKYYDYAIFADVSSKTQMSRILNRNGEGALSVFRDRWIPMEEKYFLTFNIKELCDISITTE